MSDSLPDSICAALHAAGLVPNWIVPAVDGESVAAVFVRGRLYADIESYESGEVLAAISSRKTREIWDASDFGIAESVGRIKAFLGDGIV